MTTYSVREFKAKVSEILRGLEDGEEVIIFPEIPEMHDRLIAATSAALNAPVLTRDQVLSASPRIKTVW